MSTHNRWQHETWSGDCTDPRPEARALGCLRRFSFLRPVSASQGSFVLQTNAYSSASPGAAWPKCPCAGRAKKKGGAGGVQGLFESESTTQRGVRAQGQCAPPVWQGSGTLPHGCRPSADPRCARHAGMPKALPPQTGGARACAGAGRALARACPCLPQGLPGTVPGAVCVFPGTARGTR